MATSRKVQFWSSFVKSLDADQEVCSCGEYCSDQWVLVVSFLCGGLVFFFVLPSVSVVIGRVCPDTFVSSMTAEGR